MDDILSIISKRTPLFMVMGVAIGLAFPKVSELVRPYVVPISILMALVSMLRIEPKNLLSVLKRPLFISAAMFFVLIILPLITFIICRLVGLPNWLTTGLTFASAAPPLSSAAAFAILVRLDPGMVTGLAIPATIIAPFTVWVLTSALPTLGEGVDLSGLTIRLSAIILGSLAVALLIRRLIGGTLITSWSIKLDGITVVLVALIAIGVMHDIGIVMRANPFQLIFILSLAALVSYGSLALSICGFWILGKDEAFSVGLLSSVKNMAVMVAAVVNVVEPEIALVVICAQFPIFFTPLIMRPSFGYLRRKN